MEARRGNQFRERVRRFCQIFSFRRVRRARRIRKCQICGNLQASLAGKVPQIRRGHQIRRSIKSPSGLSGSSDLGSVRQLCSPSTAPASAGGLAAGATWLKVPVVDEKVPVSG